MERHNCVIVNELGSIEDLCENSAGVLSAYMRCSPSSLVWSGDPSC